MAAPAPHRPRLQRRPGARPPSQNPPLLLFPGFPSPPPPGRAWTRSVPRPPPASASWKPTASSSSSSGTARPWCRPHRPSARRRNSRGASAVRRSSSPYACARRSRRWGRSRARRPPRSSWTGSSRRSAWASRVAGMEARWDVVVAGGGHAGCEAALASARLGKKTLLLTRERATIGRMSCNPAVGGLAKGQVVREIDALGGLRCQSDKALYAAEMVRILEAAPNLAVAEGTAAGFNVRGGRLAGLILEEGSTLACRAAVVTTGTFLRGLIHVGDVQREAGRWNEPPARSLSDALRALGLRLGRMKTGTPPRVRAGTVDLSVMARTRGDERPTAFSFRSRGETFPRQRQV